MDPVSHVGPEGGHVGAVARVPSAGVGTAREQTLDDVIRNICNELAAMFRTTVASVHVNDPFAVHDMLTTRLLIGHDPMEEAYFNCTLTTGMVITLGPERPSGSLRYVVYPQYNEYCVDMLPKYILPQGNRSRLWLLRHATGVASDATPMQHLKTLANMFIARATRETAYQCLGVVPKTLADDDESDMFFSVPT